MSSRGCVLGSRVWQLLSRTLLGVSLQPAKTTAVQASSQRCHLPLSRHRVIANQGRWHRLPHVCWQTAVALRHHGPAAHYGLGSQGEPTKSLLHERLGDRSQGKGCYILANTLGTEEPLTYQQELNGSHPTALVLRQTHVRCGLGTEGPCMCPSVGYTEGVHGQTGRGGFSVGDR